MDITFKVENEKFNYRVCAMMINDPLFLKKDIFNLPDEFTIRTEIE